jgi:hypothetical protein
MGQCPVTQSISKTFYIQNHIAGKQAQYYDERYNKNIYSRRGIMKKIAFLLGCMLFCQPAGAVELAVSNFSVDLSRFYFSLDVTDLPEFDASFDLYTASGVCVILPPSYERFRFTFNPDDGLIIENPEVTTTGTPALDRWADGPTDHLSLVEVDFLRWVINGSISNGSQPFKPGDQLCMWIHVPGTSTIFSNLPIEVTPEASAYLKKTSTTRIVTQAGQVVPYSYRIENTSPVFIHDISLTDSNVDDAPFCEFNGNDELAPEGEPGSIVFCTAEHTVTQQEIDAEAGVSNTASVSADELDPVMTSITIPVALFASSFESPPNTITVLDNVGGDSDIAIGADGRPVIAYQSQPAGDLKVAKCLDVACTAAIVSLVHGGGNDVGSSPSITIGDDSLPVISYLDYTDGVLLVAKCNDEACRDGDETISVVDDGKVGWESSITIGLDGLPVISYRDRENEKLKVAHCNDAACSGEDETVTTLNDAAEITGGNTSIAIGDDGYPVISYQQSVTPWDGLLKVAKCNDASCVGGNETITTLDTTGGPGFESTSLALGADGNPVIAYMDTAADAITIAKCNDPACTGGDETFMAVDFSTTSMRLSLVLAPDGNPLVSYMGSLKLARCNDDACAGGDESIAIVDSAAEARSSSIAIGADGLPVISYFDETTGALKVVHCGTLECR